MKRIWVITIALIVLLFVGFQSLKPRLAAKAFENRVTEIVGADQTQGLSDGLHVYMCGAGSPLPDPKRSGPCVGVLAGDKAFVFDAGAGGARNLGPMGFPTGRTQAVFLTHLHSDHIDGLGELLLGIWINGARETPVPVIGPVGTKATVDGFNQAYALDATYRTAHHGPDIAPPSGFGGTGLEPEGEDEEFIVFQSGDVTVTAFPVDHEPVSPAWGYRVEYKDRSIVFSGDTAFDPRVAKAAQGVDVLFHEALNADMVGMMRAAAKGNGNARIAKIMADIPDYHATPIEAAQIAEMANAKALVLYHIVPQIPRDALIPQFVKGAKDAFPGPITVAEDGLIVRLPAGSDEIRYGNGI